MNVMHLRASCLYEASTNTLSGCLTAHCRYIPPSARGSHKTNEPNRMSCKIPAAARCTRTCTWACHSSAKTGVSGHSRLLATRFTGPPGVPPAWDRDRTARPSCAGVSSRRHQGQKMLATYLAGLTTKASDPGRRLMSSHAWHNCFIVDLGKFKSSLDYCTVDRPNF